MDQAFIKRMQDKVAEELRKNERETLTYWRGEVERLANRRHRDLASLTNDLGELLAKMDRRLKAI